MPANTRKAHPSFASINPTSGELTNGNHSAAPCNYKNLCAGMRGEGTVLLRFFMQVFECYSMRALRHPGETHNKSSTSRLQTPVLMTSWILSFVPSDR